MSPHTRHASTPATPAPNWEDAACRQEDPDLFFPVGVIGSALLQTEQAKQVCRRCPVRETCLEWALSTGQHTGVWGGLSEMERRVLARVPESSLERCLNAQAWIEEQLAAGRTQRSIARELGVDPKAVCRSLQRFADERDLDAVGEVLAA